MDHIRRMKNAVYPGIEVPYVCDGWPYSGPFDTYPERLGFSPSDLLAAHPPSKSATEVDILLQAWLYFGLLEEIFGPLFERKHFIKSNPAGQSIITSQRLRRLIVYYPEEVPGAEGSTWRKDFKAVEKLLIDAKTAILRREESCKAAGVLQTPVQLSIIALIQFLARRLARNYASMPANLESGLLQHLMLERGWCSRQVAHLSETVGVDCMYMVSCIERPDSQFQHSEACEVDCVVNKVDKKTYKSKHSCLDSSCGFVAASPATMLATLHSGHLPLIANREYANSDEISLLSSRDVPKYVAISHVWSHGMGNPSGNSLPKCQLARLNDMVRRLYPDEKDPVPYWMDTICVPSTPPEARSLAILKMRNTYSEAHRVLVVDANLEQIESATLGREEVALYIACSTWLTRLWTLQESALARSLYFKFGDCIIDSSELERTFRNNPSLKNDYSALLVGLFNYRYADQKDMGMPAAGLVLFLHESARNRSTSRASDEALCLGPLAGLDMSEIVRSVGVEDGMYHFWRMLKPDPSMMAFWVGPRLRTYGRRWAPATLRSDIDLKLDLRKAHDDEASGEGIVLTERGMMFRAPGLLIEQQNVVSLEASFMVASPSDNQWFVVRQAGDLYEDLYTSKTQHTEARQPTSPRVALVLKRGKRVGPSRYDESVIDDRAILVKVEEEVPGTVLYVAIICNVSVDLLTGAGLPDSRSFVNAALLSPTPSVDAQVSTNAELPAFTAKMLPDSQQWFLG